MRFLFQIPQLIYGGAEKALVCFANYLVSQGHEVEILETYERALLRPQLDARVKLDAVCSREYTAKYYASPAEIRAEKRLPQKLLKCGKLAFSKAVGYERFAFRLAAKRYAGRHYDAAINYLEYNDPSFLLDYVDADKHIQWIHIDVRGAEDRAECEALRPYYLRMDSIFCVAERARESFAAAFPELADRTHTLYNFYDADGIRRRAAEPFSFDSGAPVLLSVGRMTEQKKYPRFLGVLARLRDEGYAFRWHVLGDGYQRDELAGRIRALKLEDRVFLDGLTDNPYKYMRACDLFVLPSGWEGFPTVTVEAKILARPVLATDVSGIREQIEDGRTGLIVPNTEDGLYAGLKRLLDEPGLMEKLGDSSGMESIINNNEKYRLFVEDIIQM